VREAPALEPGTELPVVSPAAWGAQVAQAERLCGLIDQHLDFEARGRLLADLEDFRPEHLCPEQRVGVVTDCLAVVGA
ncbi:MAG TPA: hypothetical protein VFU47_14640, partial [Armatimonadota bacterium]|nr:hypothetical protein [Armatimonadota bacterium]